MLWSLNLLTFPVAVVKLGLVTLLMMFAVHGFFIKELYRFWYVFLMAYLLAMFIILL